MVNRPLGAGRLRLGKNAVPGNEGSGLAEAVCVPADRFFGAIRSLIDRVGAGLARLGA